MKTWSVPYYVRPDGAVLALDSHQVETVETLPAPASMRLASSCNVNGMGGGCLFIGQQR